MSSIVVEITLPNGEKRPVAPYEAPVVNDALSAEIVRLNEVNAGLLEALRLIESRVHGYTDNYIAGIAREAIAKAEAR